MSTVAIVVVICLAGYTYVRLKFSKEGHGHEPFAQAYERRESAKLKAAGWERLDAHWERDVPVPAGSTPGLESADARSALWTALFEASTERFHLPIDYERVVAPATLATPEPLQIHLEAAIDQAPVQIHSFDVYHKGGDLVFVPRWQQIPRDQVPADFKTRGRITLPAGKLPPGHYRVRLQANRQASEWKLDVTP